MKIMAFMVIIICLKNTVSLSIIELYIISRGIIQNDKNRYIRNGELGRKEVIYKFYHFIVYRKIDKKLRKGENENEKKS